MRLPAISFHREWQEASDQWERNDDPNSDGTARQNAPNIQHEFAHLKSTSEWSKVFLSQEILISQGKHSSEAKSMKLLFRVILTLMC